MTKQKIHRATGLPVKDADHELLIEMSDADSRRGRKTDPLNCALVKACYAQYHTPYVEVRRSMAYVSDGEVVWRYHFNKQTAVMIEVFDQTGKFPAGEYWFVPPSPSARLGRPRAEEMRRNAKRKHPRTRVDKQKTLGAVRPSGRG